MILIVAPYPSIDIQKDGMIQRIAYIDNIFSTNKRIYLDISFRRFFQKKISVQGPVTIYQLNFFIHFRTIKYLLYNTDFIYIHSAYNALKAILFSTKAHVVFDAHGIVPEELIHEGRSILAKVFSFAERQVLNRCNTLVCVTKALSTHFNNKYGFSTNRELIVLPILPRFGTYSDAEHALHAKRDERSVIYAGGMQAWQNVDKMIVAITRKPDLNYTFLSGDPNQFKVRLQPFSIPNLHCDSVPPSQVKYHYLKHKFGFVLREANLINAVACPTKLVEYLYWGIIPIFITPRIGDFDSTNLCGVTLDAFEAGILPDEHTADLMRRSNQESVISMINSAQSQLIRLKEILHISSNKAIEKQSAMTNPPPKENNTQST